jgi:predicted phage terminase large subunit-like protein
MFEPRQRRYRSPIHLAGSVDSRHGSSAALELIDKAIVELMDPESPHDALFVALPPQEGKSQECSRYTPEWLLDHDPALRIGVVSYEQDMALRWGRDIKQDIALHPCTSTELHGECSEACGCLHISIRKDSSAAGRWETPAGGGVYCVGVGGPLTGRPIDVLVIDDPVKDRAAAESSRIRDSTWDWFESVALTRLAPGAKVILIMTRWHEDDLAGRIFSRPSPLRWRKIIIPAVAVSDDPLGRAPGEELTSVRQRKPGYFRHLMSTMSNYVFSGVYQQTPTAAEGNFFRRQTFRYWRALPDWQDGRERIDLEDRPVTLQDTWRFITMDFAASTRSSADFTVASCWAVTNMGDLVLLDRARQRVPDHKHFELAEPLISRWGVTQVFVESGWWSKTFVSDARDHGIPVAPLLADTDKVTRAIPAAGRVHSGKVWFPADTSGCKCGECKEGVWLDEWCDELAVFPQGTHDDQVDTLAYAARVVVADWAPAPAPPRPGLSPYERAVETAHTAATGNGHGGDLDIMQIPY